MMTLISEALIFYPVVCTLSYFSTHIVLEYCGFYCCHYQVWYYMLGTPVYFKQIVFSHCTVNTGRITFVARYVMNY